MSHLQDANAEELLDRTRIKEITTTRQLVALSADESISKTMHTLAQHGITSAPIFDAQQNKFIGFIDVLDLAVFVSYVFYENSQKHPHLYDPKELARRFALPIKDVINVSKRDPFWTVDSNETVSFLINNFLKLGIHRVPVAEDGKIIGIVSQSDVVRFLQKNKEHIGATVNKTVHELGLDKGYIVTVRNNATLMEACNVIIANDITGLPVVDYSSGALVNNLSASDLKGLTEQSFFKLEAPLHQLFAGISKMPPVTCQPHNKLGDVLDMTARTGVHRVYVVDDKNHPVRAITLTDILQQFSRPGNPLDI